MKILMEKKSDLEVSLSVSEKSQWYHLNFVFNLFLIYVCRRKCFSYVKRKKKNIEVSIMNHYQISFWYRLYGKYRNVLSGIFSKADFKKKKVYFWHTMHFLHVLQAFRSEKCTAQEKALSTCRTLFSSFALSHQLNR